MVRAWWLYFVFIGLTATPLLSQEPLAVGNEFQVNTYTTGDQFHAAVCRADSGAFVVVWERGSYIPFAAQTELPSIAGQRYDSAGQKLGTEFQVNTYTIVNLFPDIACQPNGDFVVAWAAAGYNYPAVVGRRFDSAGNALGTEFLVPSGDSEQGGTGYLPIGPGLLYSGLSVAPGAGGGFVVVWQTYGDTSCATAPGTAAVCAPAGGDGDEQGIFGRVFDGTGAPIGGDFLINTYTEGNQVRPAVDSDGQGNFVVVWGSGDFYGPGQDGSQSGVFGQRFSSAGGRVGTEFQVNTFTDGNQGGFFEQAVGVDADGDFVVVWTNSFEPGNIEGQRFSSSGLPAGSEFAVTAFTSTVGDVLPSVAMDQDGDFVVAWARETQYTVGYFDVFAHRFDSAGAPLGSEFQVNTYTVNSQGFVTSGDGFALLGSGADVASTPAGDFVVAWESGLPAYLSGDAARGASAQAQIPVEGQDGDGIGVFGQLYAIDTPTSTPTSTPTITPTGTIPPIQFTPPAPGTGPVCGTADPDLGDECLEVCSVGDDNQPYTMDDDCSLGQGGTDANGRFCIAVMPPLELGDRIYVRDVCGSGGTSTVALVIGPAAAPALSGTAILLALGGLGLVALGAFRRLRVT